MWNYFNFEVVYFWIIWNYLSGKWSVITCYNMSIILWFVFGLFDCILWQSCRLIYLFIHFYLFCLSCIDIYVHGHGHIFLRVFTNKFLILHWTLEKSRKGFQLVFISSLFFFWPCCVQSSVIVTHWLSCPLACGSQFPNQGSNSYPLH